MKGIGLKTPFLNTFVKNVFKNEIIGRKELVEIRKRIDYNGNKCSNGRKEAKRLTMNNIKMYRKKGVYG